MQRLDVAPLSAVRPFEAGDAAEPAVCAGGVDMALD
jgi:hypothetical protein